MSIIIDKLPKITIVSDFGYRVREGKKEFHPGIDIRVVDEKYTVMDVLAQEDVEIIERETSKRWGHALHAKPINKNALGIDGFTYWHIVSPHKVGDIVKKGESLGTPESGYVSLHLHFETLTGADCVHPVPYLRALGADVEYKKSQG